MFFSKKNSEMKFSNKLENLVTKHTAFKSLHELITVDEYFPALNIQTHPELSALADAYDQIQQLRGDKRRACRV